MPRRVRRHFFMVSVMHNGMVQIEVQEVDFYEVRGSRYVEKIPLDLLDDLVRCIDAELSKLNDPLEKSDQIKIGRHKHRVLKKDLLDLKEKLLEVKRQWTSSYRS